MRRYCDLMIVLLMCSACFADDTKPLSIRCWSWSGMAYNSPDAQEYVDLSRNAPLSAWNATADTVERVVSMARVADEHFPQGKLPYTLPASISLALSPDHHGVLEADPKNMSSLASNLDSYRMRLESIRGWLAGRVPVSAIILDSESYGVTGDAEHDAAVRLRHDAYYLMCKQLYPDAEVVYWGSGGAAWQRKDDRWTTGNKRGPGELSRWITAPCYNLPDHYESFEAVRRTRELAGTSPFAIFVGVGTARVYSATTPHGGPPDLAAYDPIHDWWFGYYGIANQQVPAIVVYPTPCKYPDFMRHFKALVSGINRQVYQE